MYKHKFVFFGLVMLFGCVFFLLSFSLSSSTIFEHPSLRITNRQYENNRFPLGPTLTWRNEPDDRLLLKETKAPNPKHFSRGTPIPAIATALVVQSGCTLKVPSAGINTIGTALNRARSGCTIEVDAKRGPFRESSLFVNFDNLKIVSTNGSAVIQGNRQEPIFIIENRKNVTIQGFTLTNALSTVFVADSKGVMIQGNKIQRSTSTGILTFASTVEISANEITDTKKDDEGQFGWGIDLEESSTGTLTGNKVLRSAGTGVFVRDSRATLNDNQINDNQEDGVFFSNSKNSSLTDNTLKNNVRTSVVSFDSVLQLSNNRVLETRATSDGRFGEGVDLEENTTATLTGNTFSQNASHGLSVLSSTVTVKNNTMNQNKGSGVFLSGSSNATVEGNTLRQNGTGISLIQGDNNTVENNVIADNEGIGIRMDDSVGNTLIENVVVGNEGPGLSIFRGQNGRQKVNGNLFMKNTRAGISIFKSNGDFSSNLILQNGGDGLRSEAASPTLSGNIIALNEENGVLGIDAAFPLSGNIITTNGLKGIGRFSTEKMLSLSQETPNAVWNNGTGDYLLLTASAAEQKLHFRLSREPGLNEVLGGLFEDLTALLAENKAIDIPKSVQLVQALIDGVQAKAPTQLPPTPLTFVLSNEESQRVDGLKLTFASPVKVITRTPFTNVEGDETMEIILSGGNAEPGAVVGIQVQTSDPLERPELHRWMWSSGDTELVEHRTLSSLFGTYIDLRNFMEQETGRVLIEVAFRDSNSPITKAEIKILEETITRGQSLLDDITTVKVQPIDAHHLNALQSSLEGFINYLEAFLRKFAAGATSDLSAAPINTWARDTLGFLHELFGTAIVFGQSNVDVPDDRRDAALKAKDKQLDTIDKGDTLTTATKSEETIVTNQAPERNTQQEPENSPPTSCALDVPHGAGIDVIDAGNCGCCSLSRKPSKPSTGDDDVGMWWGSGVGLYLHSGEVFTTETDLEIPGRGFSWRFERKYRSGIDFDGPLGRNWEFNYNRRLIEAQDGNVVRVDGYTRSDTYTLEADGSYTAPTGFYTRLVKNPDGSFSERDASGNQVDYAAPDASGVAQMVRLSDRNDNTMRFRYNDQAQLVEVIEPLGRAIMYAYNGDGRLVRITDFYGRALRFEYNLQGQLVATTSPTVSGTPNGNDFPEGKRTLFGYTLGLDDSRLNHNLLTVTAPNEVAVGAPARIELAYGTDPEGVAFDQVLSQTIGGTNASGVPAGGTISYEYQELANSVGADDLVTPVSQTTVTDRNGNVTEYQFNKLGNIVSVKEFTNRDVRQGDPEFFETRFEYNRDGELLKTVYPEGNVMDSLFDQNNPDRLQQGNALTSTRLPDAKRGGDQTFIRTSETYEPIYNQRRTMTEARGNDPRFVPQNGGANSAERYTTVFSYDYEEGCDFIALSAKMGLSSENTQRRLNEVGLCLQPLGDINGDGITNQVNGNVIRVQFPTVNLPQGFNQIELEGGTKQTIVELFQYNRFGQITKRIDPEGNVTTNKYFPENDPDGDGQDLIPKNGDGPFGYLSESIQDAERNSLRNSRTDPEPAAISARFFYDPVGNVVKKIDGRGIATEYVVNELNQVVQTRYATTVSEALNNPEEAIKNTLGNGLVAFGYIQNTSFDFNDNLVLYQVEDRGDTSNVGGNNVGSGTAFVDYENRYDILDNLIEQRAEVSDAETLITLRRFDPNGNLVFIVQPEGNAKSFFHDERDLVFQMSWGAVTPLPLTLSGPDDLADFDVRGGATATTTYIYDQNSNLVERCEAEDKDDSIGNNCTLTGTDRTRTLYDGFDRKASVIDAVGNQSIYQFDPNSNVTRFLLFGPQQGASPNNDAAASFAQPLSDLSMIKQPLLKATEYAYDELNRLYQTDRVLFVSPGEVTQRSANLSDGATDIDKTNLTPNDNQPIPGINLQVTGRVTTRAEFDRNSRSTFGVEDDGDIYRFFFDGVNRPIRKIDPEGNIKEIAYDDNFNVIESREVDVSQAGTSEEVFLTTYHYDALDRLQLEVDNLGQAQYYRYDSRDNLVATADAVGPTNGRSIARRAFESGPATVNEINLFGNVTLYTFDGINRMTSEERVLTVSGRGDGLHIGASLFGIKNDPNAPEASLMVPDLVQAADGKITIRYAWDRNNLLASRTDDNGNQTRYLYDNLNRMVARTRGVSTFPNLSGRADDPTTTRYTYDRDDNIVQLIDEANNAAVCNFDAINRQTECVIERAPGFVGSTKQTHQYDGLSRLTQATDNNDPETPDDDSRITFKYDSLDRVIEETQQIGTLPPQAISSQWRAKNLKSTLVYPNGRTVAYKFDRLDRIRTISDASLTPNIANYAYLGTWRVQRRGYANNTVETFLYDGLRRLTEVDHQRPDGSLIVGFGYGYDRANNKRWEQKRHDFGNSEHFTYDSVYRLLDFKRGTLDQAQAQLSTLTTTKGVIQRQRWALDGVGNWSLNSITQDGTTFEENRASTSFNEYHQIDDVPQEHDSNGNLIDDGTSIYSWDYQNRLRAVTRKTDDALVVTYSYDALSRRIRKVVTNPSTVTTDYFYDGRRNIEEREGDELRQYVYGIYIDELLVLDRQMTIEQTTQSTPQRLFYHQNGVNSVFALTDENAATVEAYQYDAYGQATLFGADVDGKVRFGDDAVLIDESTVDNPYRFTGRRLDGETGLYYYRTRYLDASRGRFLSRDTVGIWSDHLNLGNGYAYVADSPLVYVDPIGFEAGCLEKKKRKISAPAPTIDKSCKDHQQDIQRVHSSAAQYAGNAYKKAFYSRRSNPKLEKSLRTWFKDTRGEARKDINKKLRSIVEGFFCGTTTYKCNCCGCKSNWYAYVQPGDAIEICLCSKFLDRDPTEYHQGTPGNKAFFRMRLNTITHEMSHEVAGTNTNGTKFEEEVYGADESKKLARDDPEYARNNADNWGHFFEDLNKK